MNKQLPILLLLICITIGCEPPQQTTPTVKANVLPNQFVAKVIGITDGDTIDVLTDQNETIRLRLNGIDAPERGQPFGNNAKQFLSDLVGGQTIRIVDLLRDRYDRMIAELYRGEERVTLSLVKAGLAWHYVRYSDDNELALAETTAKASSLGLWNDHRFVAPWDWRKLSKIERDQLR